LKKEKDAYYQLYQIEKSKNEVAAKFITSFIANLSKKYPELVKSIPSSLMSPTLKRKTSEANISKQEAGALAQMEQVNRSLRRQIDEYKKITDQLREELSKKTHQGAATSEVNKNGDMSDLFPSRSAARAKNANILAALKSEVVIPPLFAEIDLKKWA